MDFCVWSPPKKILTDNGREFQNEEMRNLTDSWNIEMMTIAAESTFSNGRREKTVGLIKDGLRKLQEEGVEWKREILLYWIVMARNTLQMVGGYSPHQLVFGRNSEIPIMKGDVSPIMTEELPDTSLREILE